MMTLRELWTSLSKTKYGEDLEAKPDRQAIYEKRLDRCGTLCQLGIANLFWKGTTGVFKEMKDNKDPNLQYNIWLFTFCLLCMVMGTVASMFPETAPFPCFMAGTGALMALFSMFGSYHLDLLAYFSSARVCCISMGLTSALLTIYWSYAVQDPWIIHLLARMINALWAWSVRKCNEVGEKGGTFINKTKDSFRSWKEKKTDPASSSLLRRR